MVLQIIIFVCFPFTLSIIFHSYFNQAKYNFYLYKNLNYIYSRHKCIAGKKYYLLIFIFTLPDFIFAQYELGSFPLLTEQMSPLLRGAGEIGTAIPMQDALGFYYNPAQLGYFSRENTFSGFFMPKKTKWYGGKWEYPNYYAAGVTAGVNFKKNNKSLPLSIGAGFTHYKFNYGYNLLGPQADAVITQDKNYDYLDCFSVGACYEYYILFNLGFSIKPYFSSTISDYTENERGRTYYDRGTAFDFGALVIFPISHLIFGDVKLPSAEENSILLPGLSLSLGYSLSNIGAKFSRYDPEYKWLIPRTARLGYSFDIGFDGYSHYGKFNWINFSFSAEAEDILITWNENIHNYEYQNIIGDIKFKKNLIDLKADEYVILHQGSIINLLESFTIAFGLIRDRNIHVYKSNCFGVSTEGLFKLLRSEINSDAINYIAGHFILEYYYSILNKRSCKTNSQGLALYFKGIEL